MVWIRLTTMLWALVVGILLLLPGDSLPPRFEFLEWLEGWFDKVVHFALFAVLAGLAALGLGRQRTAARALVVVILLVAAYGVGLELAQGRIAGRSPEALDLAANLLGALSGPSLALWTASTNPLAGRRRGATR